MPADAPLRGKPKVKRRRKAVSPPASVFGPIGRADAGLTRARTVAHQRTQRAQRQVERRVVVPYVPKLAHPTSRQRGAANALVAASLHRQGIRTAGEVRALPKAQRRRVNRCRTSGRWGRRRSSAATSSGTAPSTSRGMATRAG
jgi:hypothetical protein